MYVIDFAAIYLTFSRWELDYEFASNVGKFILDFSDELKEVDQLGFVFSSQKDCNDFLRKVKVEPLNWGLF